MPEQKRTRAKPFTLYPMPFEEAVRRAIAAGPYPKQAKPTPPPASRRTNRPARQSDRRAS